MIQTYVRWVQMGNQNWKCKWRISSHFHKGINLKQKFPDSRETQFITSLFLHAVQWMKGDGPTQGHKWVSWPSWDASFLGQSSLASSNNLKVVGCSNKMVKSNYCFQTNGWIHEVINFKSLFALTLVSSNSNFPSLDVDKQFVMWKQGSKGEKVPKTCHPILLKYLHAALVVLAQAMLHPMGEFSRWKVSLGQGTFVPVLQGTFSCHHCSTQTHASNITGQVCVDPHQQVRPGEGK